MRPAPFESRPLVTEARRSPPWAPMPGRRIGRSGHCCRTRRSSSGVGGPDNQADVAGDIPVIAPCGDFHVEGPLLTIVSGDGQ